MIIYFDESGDLGWTLDKPYRNGGSSRYLTISFLAVPPKERKFSKRIVLELHKRFRINLREEIKGADLTIQKCDFIVDKVIDLLAKHPQIRIYAITVNKNNVMPHIRADSNKLYNYMVGLALLEEIKNEPTVTLIPDPRTLKVKSGNSLLDYLQIKLWFFLESTTKLRMETVESHTSLNLRLIDMVTHLIWCKYEDGEDRHADQILGVIRHRKLYF